LLTHQYLDFIIIIIIIASFVHYSLVDE